MKLPSPPTILTRLMSAMGSAEKNGIRPIGEIIGQDPSLSARLLKIANSPFYGLPRRMASIDQAIQMLGLQALQSLVIGTLVIERFSSLPGMGTMNEFWAASLRCGLCSKLMGSRLERAAPSPPEILFVCGLLHDIGRLVVYTQLPEISRAAYLDARGGAVSENEAVKAILGFDYYHVGAELSNAWKLPEILAVTQKYHEAPWEAPNYRLESALVALAHGIATPGDSGDPMGPGELREYTRMPAAEIKEIQALAETQLGEAMALFFPAH